MSKSLFFSVFFLFSIALSSFSTDKNTLIAKALAQDAIENAPLNSIRSFNVETSVLASALIALYVQTNDTALLVYAQSYADKFVQNDGSILTLDASTFESNNIAAGLFLFDLFNATRDAKYLRAVSHVREQLMRQPRTSDRAFLRNAESRQQLHLITLYDICPFYARFATIFDRSAIFGDISVQFDEYDKRTLDAKTGLNFDAWSATKQENWANSATGLSNFVSAQGMAFYMLAMVESLEYFPMNNPSRFRIITNLNRVAKSIAKQQDGKTGMWYQLLNAPKRGGNLPDANASAIMLYSIQKGVRLGVMPKSFSKTASKALDGVIKNGIQKQSDEKQNIVFAPGRINLGEIDGSLGSYVGVTKEKNNAYAVAAMIKALIER